MAKLLVVACDDLIGSQTPGRECAMGILDECHIVAESMRPTTCGVDAILCLHPGDDQVLDFARIQFLAQGGFHEGIVVAFLNKNIPDLRYERGVYLPSGSARLVWITLTTLIL